MLKYANYLLLIKCYTKRESVVVKVMHELNVNGKKSKCIFSQFTHLVYIYRHSFNKVLRTCNFTVTLMQYFNLFKYDFKIY